MPSSAAGDAGRVEAAGSRIERTINEIVDEVFSQYGIDKPASENAYFLDLEMKMEGSAPVEYLRKYFGDRFEGIDNALLEATFEDMRASAEPVGTRHLDFILQNEDLAAVELVEPDGSRVRLIDMCDLEKAQFVYDFATVQVSDRAELVADIANPLPHANGTGYAQIADAAAVVKAAQRAIFQHAIGELGSDAFYSQMAIIDVALAGEEAFETVNKYLDWYSSASDEAYAPQKQAKNIARDERFPLPVMFERVESPNPAFLYASGNGVDLRIEEAADGKFAWAMSTQPDCPFDKYRAGIADTFAEAYEETYKSAYEMFSGIVDPDSPQRSSVTLDELKQNRRNLEAPSETMRLEASRTMPASQTIRQNR